MASYNISVTNAHTFVPPVQQVKSGDTVTWVDTDPDPNSNPHTVTPDNANEIQGGSGNLNTGDTFGPITISGAPRTIAYYCAYHGAPGGVGMAGQLVVTA
jgi:plastocyanin